MIPTTNGPGLIESIVNTLEGGEELAIAAVVGPASLPAEFLGRMLLRGPDGKEEGSLGVRSLDLRIIQIGEAGRDSGQLPRLLSVELSPEECQELAMPAGSKLDLFIDLLIPAPSLLIVGGGHIAQPLCTIAKALGFTVTVMDDRLSFANRERFPEADKIVAGYFSEELPRFPINRSTYIVIVTRGHAYDQQALKAVAGSRAAYVGMIGSAHKVRTVMGNLAEEGVPSAQLERVYSPIGLDIGADTPAEIAAGIMAEIVSVRRRRQRHPSSLSQKQMTNRS